MVSSETTTGELSPDANTKRPRRSANSVLRDLAPQEGVTVKLSPYRSGPEAIFLEEPNWEIKYRKAAAERDQWQDRVFMLEERLEQAEKRLAGDPSGSTCAVPGCSIAKSNVTEMPLCLIHLESAYDDVWAMWREDRKHRPERVPVKIAAQLSDRDRPWAVCYIAMGDRVKIGRTVDLAKRMRTFSAHPDQLLAVEPGVRIGNTDRERQRHREFAQWRVPGTELFERNPALDAHIETVVSTFGEPQQYLDAKPA